jgi:5-methylcytosine-specific restriction endonuclease McrA
MSNQWKNMPPAIRRQWFKVVRPAVLARDKGMCRIGYKGTWMVRVKDRATGALEWQERQCLGVADQVHHVVGHHTGLDMAYLVAACGPCNRHAGDPTKRKAKPRKASWC